MIGDSLLLSNSGANQHVQDFFICYQQSSVFICKLGHVKDTLRNNIVDISLLLHSKFPKKYLRFLGIFNSSISRCTGSISAGGTNS